MLGKGTKTYWPRLSVLVAASGRLELFRNHLAVLSRQAAAENTQYCLTVWGDYSEHFALVKEREASFASVTRDVVVDDTYFPLPIAYNRSLQMAVADRVLILGADVLAASRVLEAATRVCPGKAIIFSVRHSDGEEVVGPDHQVAAPYALAMGRDELEAIGGWDESFVDGVAFEDNDLVARILISGIEFEWNFEQTCVHQRHGRYAGNGKSCIDRGQALTKNNTIWQHKLGGYSGSLWPVKWWRDKGPPMDPETHSDIMQDNLRIALKTVGYPVMAK